MIYTYVQLLLSFDQFCALVQWLVVLRLDLEWAQGSHCTEENILTVHDLKSLFVEQKKKESAEQLE